MERIVKNIVRGILFTIFVSIIFPQGSAFAESTVVKTANELRATFAADKGGDVTLADDITLAGNYSIKSTMNLDLNGHTLKIADNKCLFIYGHVTVFDKTEKKDGKITGNYAKNYMIRVGKAGEIVGKLQLDSGSIIASGNSTDRGITILNGEVIVNGGLIEAPYYTINNDVGSNGKVTINGGEVKATDKDKYVAIYGAVGTELEINGGKITAPSFTVYQSGKFTFNDGVIEAESGMAARVNAGTQFEMNGGKIETKGDAAAITFQDGSTGIINDGEIIAEYGVGDSGGDAIVAYKNTDITINGGTFSAYGNAISGNGSDSGDSEGTNAKFTINDGVVTSSNGAAIYAPQVNGSTTINGGTLTGETGVEVRAGELSIHDGTITGESKAYEVTPNKNGLTTFGAAISVAQHTTKQPVTVSIDGGEMYGTVPFSFANALGHDQSILDEVDIKITGGAFNTINGGTSSVEAMDKTEIISGGFYDFSVLPLITADSQEISGVEHNDKKMYAVVPKTGSLLANGNPEKDPSSLLGGNLQKSDPQSDESPSEDTLEESTTKSNVPSTPNTGLLPDATIKTTTTSPIVGAIMGGLVGIYVSRKKIKALLK